MASKLLVLVLGLAHSKALDIHLGVGNFDAAIVNPNTKDAAHQNPAPKKKVDLVDVIVQAVDLMDAGILQFLKEESQTSTEQKNSDDFARIVKSQHKAMAVVRQVSSNFEALKDVARKLKRKGATALAKEVKQMQEERNQLKAAVHQLDARSQSCEDTLNKATANLKTCQVMATNISSQIDAEASREVSQKAVADARAIRKAEDDAAAEKTDTDALRSENQNLKQKLKEYEKRLADLESGGSSKTSAMSQEVQECKKEKKSLQEDKEGLVKTVQHLLKANGTETLSQSLQKEIASLQRAQLETEKVYGKKVEALREQLKTSEANAQDVKEVAQTMNEQNAELTKNNANLQSKLQSCQADAKDLQDDKKELLNSLQGTLRQNTQYQAQMAKEEIKRADNPRKIPPAPKTSQPAAKMLRGPGTSKDDEVRVMGETRAIDHYIAQTTVEEPAAEIVEAPIPEEKDVPAQVQPERKPVLPATGPEHTPLARYLTGDREHPPAKEEPTPEQKIKQEADADESIGNDVGKLLSQAEDAVNQAQVDDSNEAETDEDASDAQTLSDAAVLLQKSG